MTNRVNARSVHQAAAAAGSSASERQTGQRPLFPEYPEYPEHDSVEAALAVLTAHEEAAADTMGARALPRFDEGDIDALLDELFAHELDVDWDRARAQHADAESQPENATAAAADVAADAAADAQADAQAETPPGLGRPRSGRSAA